MHRGPPRRGAENMKTEAETKTKIKRFKNKPDKINAILSVFREGEELRVKDIVERLREEGYRVKFAHLRMFIYYHMLYKHLKKRRKNNTTYYSLK